ncbi:uncharacterized protein LOC125823369 [Solanum verrucosum]|uniref:uncharacterized protein LOC125823369 n=1 Tax=Solanum verrucosum TaxID=315347 RepID=UPI0020D14477|nr:uncharacterized protein LOC125823369 [Solanum verrucosum]
MNPPKFYGSKVEKDPEEFIVEVYKVFAIMGVTPVEMAELATYQLKGVAQIWFNQWKEARSVEVGPIEWERFKSAFLDRFWLRNGSYKVPPRFNNERVSNPKPQGGGNGSSLPDCAKCGRKHEENCLAGSNAWFGCGKMDHKIRHCPSVPRNEGDSRRRAQPCPSFAPSVSDVNAPKQNRFYAL